MSKLQQLYLVTPSFEDRAIFATQLENALVSNQVAALLILPREGVTYQQDCELFIPIAQKNNCAALVQNDTQICGRVKADGLHFDGDVEGLSAHTKKLQPSKIVGSGNITTRHDAMELGEINPDYLLFGDVRDAQDGVLQPSYDLASWWAELFQIPCVLMAGSTPDTVAAAAATKVDFVGLNGFVWQHEKGPQIAINEAYEKLS